MASASSELPRIEEDEEGFPAGSGSGSGWVEARTTCDHLHTLSSDLRHIPTPDTPCSRCGHTAENWLCLTCKDCLCSRFINKHMFSHHQESGHCIALSYSDLSVWCFNCDAYLDAQLINQLRPAHEVAYLLKFGENPPSRGVVDYILTADTQTEGSPSSLSG